MNNDAQTSPEAYFDTLSLLKNMRDSLIPISIIELHLYSYLACVLGLNVGRPIADWGYTFALTSDGFPFSRELEQAIIQLEHRGVIFIDQDGNISKNDDVFQSEYEIFDLFLSFKDRNPFLIASVNSALSIPSGLIRSAIDYSAGVHYAKALGKKAILLQEDDLKDLYDEFEAVRSVLPDNSIDLLSPAILWLSAKAITGSDTVNDI